MKLAEIQVDHCGVWNKLSLPLAPQGLTVLYGPNEAGKSTLAEFIRGVLYGFSPASETEIGRPQNSAGSLLIESESGRHRVQRTSSGDGRGKAEIVDEDAGPPATEVLDVALHGIDESLYRSLFSVDLRELQELGTLSGDEAASHIYGMSLGPAGRRLLAAGKNLKAARDRFIDPLQQDGTLVRLFERQDEVNAQLHALDRLRQQHADWCLRRDQLEQEIGDLRQRQDGIEEQLRGHRFLERAWGPWRHLRECRAELAELPVISDFPSRGLEKLDRIESDLATAAEARDRLITSGRRLCQQLKQLPVDRARWSHAGIMQGFVRQRPWLVDLQSRRQTAARQADEAECSLGELLDGLGEAWPLERLAALDLSSTAWQRLSGTARSLEGARGRLQSLKRRVQRMTASYRERQESLAECLHDLGDKSVDIALSESRERLRQVNHLARLQLREAELSQRQFSLNEHRDRLAPQLNLPRWVYIVLGVFCFMGIILAGSGLITGVATSGIAGMIYALLGITCGGLAWGLKAQFEGDARRRMEENDLELASTLGELRDVQASIAGLSGGATPGGSPIDGGELVRQAAERVAELVELARHQRGLQTLHRRLRSTRQKRQIARREVTTARATWGDLLNQIGLPESLQAGEALDSWQRLLEAVEGLRHRNQVCAERDVIDGLFQSFRNNLEGFGRTIPGAPSDYSDPAAVLAEWEKQLAEIMPLREQSRELKQQIRAQNRELREVRSRVDDLKVRRNALLIKAGAASRDEFEERARQLARRTFLEDQCADAQRDLEAVCAEHTELALVEEDLLAYDASENSRCIGTLELEAADLERDLHQAYENLGGVKHEIRALEEDSQGADLRHELEQIHHDLVQAADGWAEVEAASQVVEEMRRNFERQHQPAALVSASRLLERLTRGRYRSVWTPLGSRQLLVEDDRGRSLSVSALSRGTREQLLLSVRLAVVEQLSHQGIDLPIVLDDVFVNFDEQRAEAAADVLCDFAACGHQVLFFTCHQHLARIFGNRGIPSIELPRHEDEQTEWETHRRAG